MKKNTKHFIGMITAISLLASPFTVLGEPAEYTLSDLKKESLNMGEASESGYIPVLTDGTQFGTGRTSLRKGTDIPEKYDLRELGYMTSVKNQGSDNLCWAFSAVASAESGLIRDGVAEQTLDLSEYHLGWTTFNGKNTDSSDPTRGETFLTHYGNDWKSNGGNRYYAAATLARWYGVELEQNIGNKPSLSNQKNSISHLDYAAFLPEFNRYEERMGNLIHKGYQTAARDVVKQMLMTHGAVEVGICAKDAYYDAETNSYYCDRDNACIADHAIVLAGWDDAYVTKASEPGAWLFKNSWGTGSGEEGYFWVSYYDKSLDTPTVYAFEQTVTGEHAYSHVYQYDGTGGGINHFYHDAELAGANVFTAVKSGVIGEVGFHAMNADTQYTIRIYTDLTGAAPDTGECVLTVSGQLPYAGYYTIPLGEEVSVAKGEKFAVAVTQVSDGMYDVPLEGGSSSSRKIAFSTGESFVRIEEGSWLDVKSHGTMENICIKAFANTVEGEEEEDPIPLEPVGHWVLEAAGWWYNNGDGTWPANCWKQINGSWYAFNAAGYMRTGWFKDGSTWYYLKPSGAMATGWLKDGGTWYYLKPSGAMATGWLKDGGTWYYLKPSGAMATGWLKDGSTWYYLASSGAMMTGWYQVAGVWYYSYPSGAMAADTWIGNYYVDPSGAWRP